ncbi:MAG: UDP-N-acetylmuramoyl-tripeptide--D-alanyl-D-alanine ligase [Chloroflexota bacterium]
MGHVLEALTDYRATSAEPVITSVVIDSREAIPGCLFVAFVGERHDGHDFVADAFNRGAIAALVSRLPETDDVNIIDTRQGHGEMPDRLPAYILVEDTLTALQDISAWWRSRFNISVTGITGSVGKTSTKELASAVLSRRFHTLKSSGNQNNEIGVPLTLLKLEPQYEQAVIEMGMYELGEIARFCELARPQVGVITNISPVHLERLGSIENIVRAKQELVEALPEDGIAILNRDDDWVMGMAQHTNARVFTYGLDDRADLWASDISSMGLDGIRFQLHYDNDSMNLRIPLLGRHSVHTALRASAIGLAQGMSWPEIAAGMSEMSSQLRLVAAPGPYGSILIDDTYNSSPESALAALNLLQDLDGRRVAVLGDMLELGTAEWQAHRRVGLRAAEVADILVTVGPRSHIAAEAAVSAGLPRARVIQVNDAPEAVPVLLDLIEPGDVVLIKGSLGMAMDRIVSALGRDA